jgi:hypothetical protein
MSWIPDNHAAFDDLGQVGYGAVLALAFGYRMTPLGEYDFLVILGAVIRKNMQDHTGNRGFVWRPECTKK